MAAYKSGTNYQAANNVVGDVVDDGTNTIIDTGVGFGDAPLAEHVVSQMQYGVVNGQFNLFPPDAALPISETNKLPFWDVRDLCTTPESIFAAVTTLDGGATYGVTIDPTGAIVDDQIVLTTRIPVLTDTNLAIRQKLASSLTKSSAYSSTNQWDLVVTAEYFDHLNESLGSVAVGTASHNQSWTAISGLTTTGGSAIASSAAYCDITYTLTATTTVTDTTTLTINSCFIATSSPLTNSFLVTETFLASGTFTRPTGVEFVTVVAMGGGGGGGGGALRARNDDNVNNTAGGSGGASGPWVLLRDLYVGDVATVSVGIGAGGAGGAGTTFSKVAGSSNTPFQAGGVGGAGGATTFSTYLSVGGGTATASSGFYGMVQENGSGGGIGGFATGNASINATAGSAHAMSAYTSAPFSVAWVSTGAAGTNGTASGGGSFTSGTAGTANASLGIGGSGGGGGGAVAGTNFGNGSAGGAAASGSGGGGARVRINAASLTSVVTGGAGASAPTASRGGGGGGGGASCAAASTTANYTGATLTMTSGSGGAGGSGWLVVAYTA